MVMQTALQERENQVSSTLSSGKMMSKFAFRNRQTIHIQKRDVYNLFPLQEAVHWQTELSG